jgi:hypothetical protein
VPELVGADLDAGVGEREEGDDDKARPGMEQVLEPFVGRNRQGNGSAGRTGEFR